MNNLKIGFSVGQGMMLYWEFPLSFREIVVAFLIWKEQEAYKAAVLKRFFQWFSLHLFGFSLTDLISVNDMSRCQSC